jgi:hypothetical protein
MNSGLCRGRAIRPAARISMIAITRISTSATLVGVAKMDIDFFDVLAITPQPLFNK